MQRRWLLVHKRVCRFQPFSADAVALRDARNPEDGARNERALVQDDKERRERHIQDFESSVAIARQVGGFLTSQGHMWQLKKGERHVKVRA